MAFPSTPSYRPHPNPNIGWLPGTVRVLHLATPPPNLTQRILDFLSDFSVEKHGAVVARVWKCMKLPYMMLAGTAALAAPLWFGLGQGFENATLGAAQAMPPALGMRAQAGTAGQPMSEEGRRAFNWHVGHPHMGDFDTVVIPYDGALEDYGIARHIDARIEVDATAFTGIYKDSSLLFENGEEGSEGFERVRVDYNGETLAFRYDNPAYASSVFDLGHPAIAEGVLLERALIDDPLQPEGGAEVSSGAQQSSGQAQPETTSSEQSGLVPIRGMLAWRLGLEGGLASMGRSFGQALPWLGSGGLDLAMLRRGNLYDRMLELVRGRIDEREAQRLAEARAAEEARRRREEERAGPLNPLTGLPGTPSDKPALLVKIDNVSAARPQSGINQADVVYEELVEYGLTRLAAIIHSTDATVGPVRSARTSDVDLLANLATPYFANSGMNGHVQGQINASDSVSVNHGSRPNLYRREPSRRAPHNLYAESVELRAGPADKSRMPQALFEYRRGEEALAKGAQDVRGVSINFGHTKVSYAWNAEHGGWARKQDGTAHVDIEGVQVMPENVIVQFVSYGRDEGGDARSPKAETVGSGRVMVLTNGKLIEGTWTREKPTAPLNLRTADGETIKLTPGKTWVALAPAGGAMSPGNASVEVQR